MLKQWVALTIAFFVLGWAAGSIYSEGKTAAYIPQTNTENALPNFFSSPVEKISPYDWISEEQIQVYDDRVIIELDDPEWATFTDTNSMDPVIDIGANAIEIRPRSENDIHVGDIVSYTTDNGAVIHRVIETGYDNKGWYAVMKGDNNSLPDPEKIRFNKIERILVMVIY